MTKSKRILIFSLIGVAALAIILTVVLLIINNKKPETNMPEVVSIFEGEGTTFNLEGDYVLSDIDVTATGGTDKQVVLNKPVEFNLATYSLDLNGYTLKISSPTKDCLVLFTDGEIKNGTLDVSVPKGDIDFSNVMITSSVNYTLEAASNTIYFNDVINDGSGVIKSDTHVEVSRSELNEMKLDSNADLKVNNGSLIDKVVVGASATDAIIDVFNGSRIKEILLEGKAFVQVLGEVLEFVVNEESTVKLLQGGLINKLNINAESVVELFGNIIDVVIGENAVSDVLVGANANVQNLDVNSTITLDVEGSINNVLFNEKAENSIFNIISNRAHVYNAVINAIGTTVNSDNPNLIDKIVVPSSKKDEITIPTGTTTDEIVDAEIGDYLVKHTYAEAERRDPTCVSNGSITYKCSCCEDGEVIRVVLPANGHDYTTEVVSLPAELTPGEKLHTCKICGYSYYETISATEVESKTLSSLIGLILGDGTYSIEMDTDSFIMADQKSGFNKNTFKIAKFVFDVTDGHPEGYIEVVSEMYVGKFDIAKEVSTYLYVNGNTLFIDLDDRVEKIDVITFIKNVLYDSIGYESEFKEEYIIKAFNYINRLASVLSTYEPVFDSLFSSAEESLEDVDVVEIIFGSFCETVENDDGGIEYYFAANALREIADIASEKTGEQVIEMLFGEGSYKNIVRTLKRLPYYTIEEIARTVISYAENYGADVEGTFDLIEEIVFDISGAELDIQEVLSTQANIPLATLVFENAGFDTADELAQDFIYRVGLLDEKLVELTIDKLYNWIVYGDPDYKVPVEEEIDEEESTNPEELSTEDLEPELVPYFISQEIDALADMIENMVSVGLEYDAQGKLVSFIFNFDNKISLTYCLDTEIYYFNVKYFDYQLVASYTQGEEEIQATVDLLHGDSEIPMYTGILDVVTEEGNTYISILLHQNDVPIYKLIIDVETEDGATIVDVSLFGKTGDEENGGNEEVDVDVEEVPSELVLMYNMAVQINPDMGDYSALLIVFDEVMAEIVADIDRSNDNTVFDFDGNAFGYSVAIDADENEGTAGFVVARENEEQFKALLSTDEDGEVFLSIYVMGAEDPVVMGSVDYVDIYNYSTSFVYYENGAERTILIDVSEHDDLYVAKISSYTETILDAIFELNLEFISTENREGVILGVSFSTLSQGILEEYLSAELIFEVERNSDDKPTSFYVGADGKVCIHNSTLNGITTKEYLTFDFGVTIDVESNLTITEEEKDKFIDGDFKLMGNIEVAEKDIIGTQEYVSEVNSIKYIEDDNGGHYEIISKKYEVVIDIYNENYATLNTTEFKTTVPAEYGIPALGIIFYYASCGNVYLFEYELTDYMKKTVVEEYGLLSVDEDGYVKIDTTVQDGSKKSENIKGAYCISIKAYYDNVEQKQVEKVSHKIKYSYRLLDEDLGCKHGKIIHQQCENCDYENFTCDYSCVFEQISYDEEYGINVIQCQSCDDLNIYYDNCTMSLYQSRDMTIIEFKELLLEFDVQFDDDKYVEDSLSVNDYTCSNCNLVKSDYTWITEDENTSCYSNNLIVFTDKETDEVILTINYSTKNNCNYVVNEVDVTSSAPAMIGKILNLFDLDMPSSIFEVKSVCSYCNKVKEGSTSYVLSYDDGDSFTIAENYINGELVSYNMYGFNVKSISNIAEYLLDSNHTVLTGEISNIEFSAFVDLEFNILLCNIDIYFHDEAKRFSLEYYGKNNYIIIEEMDKANNLYNFIEIFLGENGDILEKLIYDQNS